MKTAPIGVCDLCDEPFPPGVPHLTSKGKPRLYCSRECRNTANSRAGAGIRSEQMKARIRHGEWENPSPLVRDDATDEETEFFQSRVSAGISKMRKQEIAEDRWRNPALDPEARRKLSRPRKHDDDPVLHAAIEKLGRGVSMADLTPEERETYRAHRRGLRRARGDQVRAYRRRRYSEEMATEEGRAKHQAKWQRQRRRLAQRKPNHRLVEARQQMGLSQDRLAQLLDVSQAAISKWERFSTVPRSETLRQQVEDLLGPVWSLDKDARS